MIRDFPALKARRPEPPWRTAMDLAICRLRLVTARHQPFAATSAITGCVATDGIRIIRGHGQPPAGPPGRLGQPRVGAPWGTGTGIKAHTRCTTIMATT